MDNTLAEDMLVFNGLDATNGSYLAEPVSLIELRDRAFNLQQKNVNLWQKDEHLEDLKARDLKLQESFDLNRDVAPDKLIEAGWGIIFPEEAGKEQVDQILEALSDLIKLRRCQAGERFHIYYGDGDGYQPGETGEEFTSRHGIEFGSVDPSIMPFYLLIVADPASIPYSFQYQLDVQLAVGRIYFEGLDEYAQYARSVWTAEQEPAQVSLARQAVFFGAANPDDKATDLSSRLLVDILFEYVDDEQGKCKTQLGWMSERVPVERAYKKDLLKYLGGNKTPALMFTATHGLGWPSGHPQQQDFQGALVCQDWPGPKEWPAGKPMPRDFYLGAEDIDKSASLLGSIAFLFACYGAGTPHLDDYSVARDMVRKRLAPRPFLSALPRRLLSHPGGGALAVIGHVERAWGYSFKWRNEDAKPESFKNFLYETMRGMPIGYAMESLNNRYGQIATAFSREIEKKLSRNRNYDAYLISRLWMANNDARAYAILGDPAVRMPLTDKGAAQTQRPAISGVTVHTGQLPAMLVPDSVDEDGQPFAVSQGAQGDDSSGSQKVSSEQADNSAQRDSHLDTQQSQVVRPRSPMDGLAMALETYETDAESFGINEDLQKLVGPVVKSLFDALQQTAQKLQEAANQATTLKISTGIVDDLNTFDPLKPAPGEVDKRFVTTISLTGDTQLFLSRQADSSDEVLLNLHKEMVAQAHTNRMEMIKTLTGMIAGLFGSGN